MPVEPGPKTAAELLEAIEEANALAGTAQGRGAPTFDHAIRIRDHLKTLLDVELAKQNRGTSIHIDVRGMTNTVEQKKAHRFRVLEAAYGIADGNPEADFREDDIAERVQLSKDEISAAVTYLTNEGLLESVAFGGVCAITHRGIREFEEAQSQPTKPTEYFPSVMNIMHVERMEHSVIQQGTSGSYQTVTEASIDVVALAELLRELRGVTVRTEDRETFSSDLDTIDAQLRRPSPKPAIIGESLKSVRTILEAIGATLLAGKIGEFLSRWPL